MDIGLISLIAITFCASIINGGLGYGFSSTTVPVALLFYTNRILNPVLVPIEVLINIYVLVLNRKAIPSVWKRVRTIFIGVAPGVLIGSYLISSIHPGWTKFFTYTILLPLIVIQAAGIRRPIQREKIWGIPFGAGVGFLYSVTTVSGPPLAVMFNNQGFVKNEFRAALGIIRFGLASLTTTLYYLFGLYSISGLQLFGSIMPGVLIGIPLGSYLIHRLDPETFRRICMSFDAWVIGFGLSHVLIELKLVASPYAYILLILVLLIDGFLLYTYFTKRRVVLVKSRSV